MDDSKRQMMLDLLGQYADQVASAAEIAEADQKTFTAAYALFQSGAWVDEWLRESPEPKRHANNWKPDSKSRFDKWLRWKLEQGGHSTITYRRTYQLLNAGEIVHRVPTLNSCTKLTEGALRPLTWVLTNRYEERLPEIAAAAVEAAGSVDAVTQAHTKEALSGFKQTLRGPRGGKSARAITAAARANRLRKKILTEFVQMYDLACMNEKAQPEFEGLLADLDEFLEQHRAEAA